MASLPYLRSCTLLGCADCAVPLLFVGTDLPEAPEAMKEHAGIWLGAIVIM